MIENVGVFVTPLEPRDYVDDLQLNWIVGKIQKGFSQQEACDEDEHADGIKKQCIGDGSKEEEQERSGKDKNAMFR